MRRAALDTSVCDTHIALRQLVVITDLNVICITVFKAKTYPPLIVDRNRILAFPVTFQRMEAIAWRRAQVFKCGSEVHVLKFSRRPFRDICREVLCLSGKFLPYARRKTS
jgi:hypothetical protein